MWDVRCIAGCEPVSCVRSLKGCSWMMFLDIDSKKHVLYRHRSCSGGTSLERQPSSSVEASCCAVDNRTLAI